MCRARGGPGRHFLGGADVDHLEIRLHRGRERGQGHLDAGIVASDAADHAAVRRDAAAAAGRLQFDAGKRREIQQEHLSVQLSRHSEQDLQAQHRLQGAADPGHRTEHARLRAISDHAVCGRIRPQAAQARLPALGLVDLQLALVLVDAREHGGTRSEHRRIVDEEFRAEIVAAVDHEIVGANQIERIVGVEAYRMGLNGHARVDGRGRGARQLRFGQADIGQREHGLAMQIARLEGVRIHDPEMPDSRARQILQHRAAEAAGADDEHAARGELRLAVLRPPP